jgi:hypothetical protein
MFFVVLSKVLHRHLIVPKFHCYINEPAGCYLDAVFDTYPDSSKFLVLQRRGEREKERREGRVFRLVMTIYKYGLAELGYFENSFLRNPQVPSANLHSTKIYLPTLGNHVWFIFILIINIIVIGYYFLYT